jgi:response regulator RpfG family c-di-GMP phosphodiesterase
MKGSGTHFDPEMVDALVALQDEFKRVSRKYSDAGL